MNVHHLELFYYVARHRGISCAVRHMPYGIQQPAVSSQISQLERDLGTRLFERNPFRLTKPGEELFEFIRPFFGNLDAMKARLGKSAGPVLRIGAAELMLRDYLPPIVRRLRAREPQLQLSLRSGFTAELETALRNREIDVAIVPQEGHAPAGLHRLSLLEIPLVLLVPKKSPVRSAEALWSRDRIDVPLISLPASEVVSRVFKKGLKRRWVDWPCAIEASSLDLIPQYVANGYGYGVSVDAANLVQHARVRSLPLAGFDPVEIAILWQGRPTPLIQGIVAEAQRFVREHDLREHYEETENAPAPKHPRRGQAPLLRLTEI
jgi:DNA-binding transcriptional LysR family regulator